MTSDDDRYSDGGAYDEEETLGAPAALAEIMGALGDEKRLCTFNQIMDGTEKKDIHRNIDASRSGVQRFISDYEDIRLIEEVPDNGYQLTEKGDMVYENLKRFDTQPKVYAYDDLEEYIEDLPLPDEEKEEFYETIDGNRSDGEDSGDDDSDSLGFTHVAAVSRIVSNLDNEKRVRAFEGVSHGMDLKELPAYTGASRSGVQRFVSNYADVNLVEKDSGTGHYRLTGKGSLVYDVLQTLDEELLDSHLYDDLRKDVLESSLPDEEVRELLDHIDELEED